VFVCSLGEGARIIADLSLEYLSDARIIVEGDTVGLCEDRGLADGAGPVRELQVAAETIPIKGISEASLLRSSVLSRDQKNKLLIAAGCPIYVNLWDVDSSEGTPFEFPPSNRS
jgi:hypothetical protein